MTQRAAFYVKGGAGERLPAASRGNARRAFLATFPGNATVAPLLFKNEGYYVSGGVWETWTTTGAPATVPPSGHTLTNLQHTLLQQ